MEAKSLLQPVTCVYVCGCTRSFINWDYIHVGILNCAVQDIWLTLKLFSFI